MIKEVRTGEVKIKETVCGFHKVHPSDTYAGCTCSASYVKGYPSEKELEPYIWADNDIGKALERFREDALGKVREE